MPCFYVCISITALSLKMARRTYLYLRIYTQFQETAEKPLGSGRRHIPAIRKHSKINTSEENKYEKNCIDSNLSFTFNPNPG